MGPPFQLEPPCVQFEARALECLRENGCRNRARSTTIRQGTGLGTLAGASAEGPRRDALTLRLVESRRVLSFLGLSAYTPNPFRVSAPALPTATEIAR